MESGYNSHARLSEAHFGGDALFNQEIPYGSSPSGYYYNSTPPIKPRSIMKGDAAHFLEFNAEESLARKLNFLTSSLSQGKPIVVEDLMSLRTNHETDPKVVQLLGELHSELRLAANTRPSGQLESHLPVLNPPAIATTSGQKGHFDAHAVYAGDDAMSAGRWSQLATAGVRSALSALMSRFGLDTYNPPHTTSTVRSSGKPVASLTNNLPSTSSQSAFGS